MMKQLKQFAWCNFLLLIVSLIVTPINCETTNKSEENISNNTKFVATNEWQVVKKGTPLPKGLHIRHNFETGVTEAKLWDKDDDEAKENVAQSSLTLHPDEALRKKNNDEQLAERKPNVNNIPIEELKYQLKKLKMKLDEDNSILSAKGTAHGSMAKKPKNWDVLKDKEKSVRVGLAPDGRSIEKLFLSFEKFKRVLETEVPDDPEDLELAILIIHEFERHAHQIDNAQAFADLGGMKKIIQPCLNGTNTKMKLEALRLFGAAVQSNPKVQLNALECDMVHKILHLLKTTTSNDVVSRCVFALGALIRQFPTAQKTFVDHGGLEIFGDILASHRRQAQIRVMTLINDLTIERQDLQQIDNVTEQQQRIREYGKADFENKLMSQNYCKNLNALLLRSLELETNKDFQALDEDFLDTLFTSIATLMSSCHNEFHYDKESLLANITEILVYYQSLSEPNEELIKNIQRVRKLFSHESHDEL